MPYLKNMKMVITSFCRGKAVKGERDILHGGGVHIQDIITRHRCFREVKSRKLTLLASTVIKSTKYTFSNQWRTKVTYKMKSLHA